MPKNIFTPRNELVCGKLDEAHNLAVSLDSIELVDLLADIRHDCERMEQKLIARKAEVAELLAMLIEVRGDVCENYNYKAWDDDFQGVQRIKDRLDRLDALIARHS